MGSSLASRAVVVWSLALALASGARASEDAPRLTVSLLADRTRSLGPADVLRPPWRERFEAADGPVSFGIGAPPIWARFSVENPAATERRVALTWPFPLYDRVDVYLVGAGGPVLHARGGLAVPRQQRTLGGFADGHTAWITMPARSRVEGLVRAETRVAGFAGLAARGEAEHERHQHRAILLLGAGLGFAALLAAISLAAAAVWRERSLFWYAGFVLSFGAYSATMAGAGGLLGDPPLVLGPVGEPLFSGLTGFAGAFFVRSFHARRAVTRADRALGAIGLAHLSTAALAFVSVGPANLMAAVLAAVTLGLGLSVAVAEVRRGSSRGRWFLTGFAAFAVLGVLFALSVVGAVRPDPDLLFAALQVGFALTAVCLAFGVAGRKLDESEARFRVAFETSPDATLVTRLPDGVIMMVNPGFSRTFGWSAEEAIGRSTVALGAWEVLAERDAFLAEVAGTGATTNRECRFRTRSGASLVGLLSARTTRVGEQECMLTVVRDVTALKAAERERARLTEELQQAHRLEALGRLAGGIAHEFNNLLAVIRTNSNLSLLEIDPTDPSRESFQEIKDAATRAAELTRQLLSFGRHRPVEHRPLDLTAQVDSMRGMLRRLLGEDLRLEFALGPGLPKVHADRGQIEQVVMNLAINAREALRYGGAITIATAAEVLAEGSSRGHPAGAYCVISVSDTGAGMTEEVRRRVLEPFFSTKEGGTGLGLSIVHGIASEHGGFVDVESAPERGSTFRVYFPVGRPPRTTRGAGRHGTSQPRPDSGPARAT